MSRSDRRDAADPAEGRPLSASTTPVPAESRTEDVSDRRPPRHRPGAAAEFGFGADQFGCLDSLWNRESGWSLNADNPSSGAYGIPQALPGSKMASAGADWATNPATQISWGLGYIRDRYGSPAAPGARQSHGWY